MHGLSEGGICLEWVCKLAGAFFVLGSTGYLAININSKIDQRGVELRRLYSILLQLKSEIQYMSNPLPICFERFGQQEKEPFKGWFEQMAGRMQEKDNERFAEVWEEETERLYERCALQHKDMEPLYSLKDKLGTLDVVAQSKAIDYVLLQLEQNRKQLEEEMKQKKKMIMSLSLFVGFMTLILFI